MDTEVPLESWIYFCNASCFLNNSCSRRYHRSQPNTINNAVIYNYIYIIYITHEYFYRYAHRERKYDSLNGISACASFGGPGLRSERVPSSLPSLPRTRRPRGSCPAAFGHLLPPEGPSRGRRGRRALPRPPGSQRRIMPFSPFPAVPRSPGQAGGEPARQGREQERARPGRAHPPRSLCPPLPKLSSPGSWAAQEEVRAGGGGRIGRAEVRNNNNKQTKPVECQRLSRFIPALS